MSRTIPEVSKEKSSTRTILPKLPQALTSKVPKFKGFLDFMKRYSIVSLALAVVIGTATKDTVNALVTGIITPAIQLLLPNMQLQDLVVKAGKAEFKIGLFLDSFIQMMIILLLLYIVIVVLFKKGEVLGVKEAPEERKVE